LFVALIGIAGSAEAQEHAHAPAADGGSRWTLTWSASAFLQFNDQERRFTDFRSVESQNWFMGGAERRAAGGTLRLDAMLSLEPLTMKRIGSPQVFQTGETFDGAPLIDYQHPHDLVMQLGASYTRRVGSTSMTVGADVVGAPAFGPPAFMHRASASENPTAPLGHHNLDATHVTPGVIRIEARRGGGRIEASWFRGREPDENRFDLDLGALDSWAVRGGWSSGAWSAQLSGGRFTRPDPIEPLVDVVRLSGSIAWDHRVPAGRVAALVAWGQHRDVYGAQDSYLAEATISRDRGDAFYSRVEVTSKNILTAGGLHPPGFRHPHVLSTVGALTAGYTHRVRASLTARVSLGGDITVHRVPLNLREPYGSPVSARVFLHFSAGEPHRH
jgi:hypothetical protein